MTARSHPGVEWRITLQNTILCLYCHLTDLAISTQRWIFIYEYSSVGDAACWALVPVCGTISVLVVVLSVVTYYIRTDGWINFVKLIQAMINVITSMWREWCRNIRVIRDMSSWVMFHSWWVMIRAVLRASGELTVICVGLWFVMMWVDVTRDVMSYE